MARPKQINPKVNITRRGRGKAAAWSCYWQADGKTIRRGCNGAKSEAQARTIGERRFREWASPPPPATFTIGELLDAYLPVRTIPSSVLGVFDE